MSKSNQQLITEALTLLGQVDKSKRATVLASVSFHDEEGGFYKMGGTMRGDRSEIVRGLVLQMVKDVNIASTISAAVAIYTKFIGTSLSAMECSLEKEDMDEIIKSTKMDLDSIHHVEHGVK